MPIEVTQNEQGEQVVKVGDGDSTKTVSAREAEQLLSEGPKPFDEQTIDVTVDGDTLTMTGAELKEAASKARGADKRFKEASELRKEAEHAIRAKKLNEKFRSADIKSWDLDEVRELCQLQDVPQNEAEQYVQYIQGVQNGTIQPDGTQTDTSTSTGDEEDDTVPQQYVSKLEQQNQKLSRRLEALEAKSKQESNAQNIQKIKGDVKKALTDDPELAILMKDTDSPMAKRLVDDVFNEVRSRVVFGEEDASYGPELLREVVQTERAKAKDLGILKNGSEQDDNTSLGSAPSLAPDVLQVEKPLKRVPPTEDGGRENFVKQLVQKVRRGGGKVE